MLMKKFLTKVLLFSIIFGMMIVSCDNGTDVDSWKNVKNANEIIGTWEGEMNVNFAKNSVLVEVLEYFLGVDVPNTSILYFFSMEYKENDTHLTYRVIADFDKVFDDIVKTNPGKTKDSLWDKYIEIFSLNLNPDITITTGKYYTDSQMNLPANLSTFEALSLSINRDGTKLKMLTQMEGQTYELILDKK